MNPQTLHSYGYGLPLHYYIYGGLCAAISVCLVVAVVVAIAMATAKREEK